MNSTDQESNKLVVRGGEAVTASELSSHLALALRLENVGVLLGAGASVSSGGKTMKQLWELIASERPETVAWLKSNRFLSGDDVPNIEKLLSEIAIAEKDSTRRGQSTEELRTHGKVIREAVIDAALLDEKIWCDRDTTEALDLLKSYHRLLVRLQGSRQPGQAAPWIFSANYDIAVEWAAETLGIHVVNGFTGLHHRHFQPNAFDLSLQNSKAKGEARFGSYNLNLAKMHGSLTWALNQSQDIVEYPSDTVRALIEKSRKDKDSDFSEYLLIQPTTAKYVDTVGYVYGELVRRFTEFLAQSNTTLIVSGYGFGDEHINRLVASGLLNPTLQLIVYYPGWKEFEKPIDNEFLEKLRKLESPRIVIVGGGTDAYFDQFALDLPDPAIVDDLSQDIKKLLMRLSKGAGVDKAQ